MAGELWFTNLCTRYFAIVLPQLARAPAELHIPPELVHGKLQFSMYDPGMGVSGVQ